MKNRPIPLPGGLTRENDKHDPFQVSACVFKTKPVCGHQPCAQVFPPDRCRSSSFHGAALPSAVTGAHGCGSIELIGYHDGRGPGGDCKDKGEDEQKLDHGHASALAIASGRGNGG